MKMGRGSLEDFAQLSLIRAQMSPDYPKVLAERRVLSPLTFGSNHLLGLPLYKSVMELRKHYSHGRL